MTQAQWFTYSSQFTGEGADLPFDTSQLPVLDASVNRDAYQAYSLRLLSSTYEGAAINVRRSSDNATSDIGFDADGLLDTDALTTFVGANSGYITTWYDQSGNARHMVQAGTTRQPRIVNAGTLIMAGDAPAVDFSAAANIFLRHTSPGMKTLLADAGFCVSEVHTDTPNGTSYAESAQAFTVINAFNWNTATPPYMRSAMFVTSSFISPYPQLVTDAAGELHADLLVKPAAIGGLQYRDGLIAETEAGWNPSIPDCTVAVLGGMETATDSLTLAYSGKVGEHILFDGVLDADSITALAASQTAYFGIS